MSQPSRQEPLPPPEGTPTHAQLRSVFERVLGELLATPPGQIPGGAPTDMGLDWQVAQALGELAELKFLDRVTDAAIDDVRATFEDQLDGTHAREDEHRIAAAFEARGR